MILISDNKTFYHTPQANLDCTPARPLYRGDLDYNPQKVQYGMRVRADLSVIYVLCLHLPFFSHSSVDHYNSLRCWATQTALCGGPVCVQVIWLCGLVAGVWRHTGLFGRVRWGALWYALKLYLKFWKRELSQASNVVISIETFCDINDFIRYLIWDSVESNQQKPEIMFSHTDFLFISVFVFFKTVYIKKSSRNRFYRSLLVCVLLMVSYCECCIIL